jgi:alpha-beta hydrolase superfamily lysophospholipase
VDPNERSKLALRAAGVVGVVLLLVAIVGTWAYSGVLRDELVSIDRSERNRDIEVATVGSGRIEVARTPLTETEGIWGVDGPNGYGQASVVIASTEGTVERAFRTQEGSFDVGDLVRFDPIAYPGDPLEAHGIEFDEVRFTGDLGVYPAWVIDGDRDLWVLIVHGSGPAERAEALRFIPGLVAQRYPVMVITVRGDADAPRSRTGLRALGATEWRDLASAVEFALSQDAEEFVVMGLDTGASTVAMYLQEADDASAVKGAVFDSALHDPERLADRLAAERKAIGPLRAAGKLLARIRFDIDWEELDQIERAGQYSVPILVMHGTADEVVPLEIADDFVAGLGDLATYEVFEGGIHSQLWNVDPARYDRALLDFIERVGTAE